MKRDVIDSSCSNDFLLCLTSIQTSEKAKEIARVLLQKNLVACINITAEVNSLYHWKNKIIEESEVIMMMKTVLSKVPELKACLFDLHPYEVPEFIQLNINDSDKNYLDWIAYSV